MAEVGPEKEITAPLSLTATSPPVIRSDATSGGSGAVEIPGTVLLTVPSHGWPAGSEPRTTASSVRVAIEYTLPALMRFGAESSGYHHSPEPVPTRTPCEVAPAALGRSVGPTPVCCHDAPSSEDSNSLPGVQPTRRPVESNASGVTVEARAPQVAPEFVLE